MSAEKGYSAGGPPSVAHWCVTDHNMHRGSIAECGCGKVDLVGRISVEYRAAVAETAERERVISQLQEASFLAGDSEFAITIALAINDACAALAAPAPARPAPAIPPRKALEALEDWLGEVAHDRAAQPAGEAGPQYGKREEDALEIVHGLRELEETINKMPSTHRTVPELWADREKVRRAIAWIEAHQSPPMTATLDQVTPIVADQCECLYCNSGTQPAAGPAREDGLAHVFADGYCVHCHVKLDDATEHRRCTAREDTP